MPSTMTSTDIVIKQYRITGRCTLRDGGHHIAGLHEAISRISIKTDGDRAKQEAAIAETLDSFGYQLARFDRDDYGNNLLVFSMPPQMSATNAQYWEAAW